MGKLNDINGIFQFDWMFMSISGTCSVVLKARDKTTNKFVAMKRVQGDREGVSAYRKVLSSRILI